MTPPTAFIIAGEASGDLHGAHLLNSLKQRVPQMTFYGMGSSQLAEAGMNVIVNSDPLSVVGFLEVLAKLKLIRQAFKKIKAAIKLHQPTLVILIDYPGFNLRLAKVIKKLSPQTQVFYFISPQIWAWRYHRIKIIKKYIDLMMVIFPFEVELYQKEVVPVKYVGNPLVEHVKTSMIATKAREFFGIKEQSILIGLMPGSREGEIKHHLPVLLKAAQQLQTYSPKIEFILPLAPTLKRENLLPYLNQVDLPLKITQERTYDAISVCDVVIVASGTATLEVALLGRPMVIFYKSSALSSAIAKKLVKIPHIALCNIVAQEGIVKELIQHDASPENMVAEVVHILEQESYRNRMKDKLNRIHQVFTATENSDMGQIIFDHLNK